MARDLRPVYTAATEAAAKERFVEFCDTWAERYPAVSAVLYSYGRSPRIFWVGVGGMTIALADGETDAESVT
jgi:hypothetical protein